MEKANIFLFTSPTCPHCPAAKRFANEFKKSRDDFNLIELSTMTPEGRNKASKFGIMTVPTFIITGHAFPDPIGLKGVQNNETMNKYLDIALGYKTLDDFKKPSISEKIFKKFKMKW